MKRVAIVILNWNGEKWLEKFLPSVVEYSGGTAVYVVDNHSKDGSIPFLKQNFPMVQVITNDQNYGFAEGYNRGLKQIKSEFYCLLNSDVEVTAGWIAPILQLFDNNPNIAAVQPKILSYDKKDTFEFAGAGGGLMDNLGYPYCRGRIFDSVEKDHGQYDDETEIFWASGCCLVIRSADFWAQQGFDSRFFAHQEEIDLCWRLINSGRKIFYCGNSTVFHVGGATLNPKNPRKTFLNIRNNLTMLLKNLPASKLYVIPLRLTLDGIAAFYFLFKSGPKHLLAVLKAHFSFYKQIPATLRLRKKPQIQSYYQDKWLVFKHFLK